LIDLRGFLMIFFGVLIHWCWGFRGLWNLETDGRFEVCGLIRSLVSSVQVEVLLGGEMETRSFIKKIV
jgi:hypothetical protein